ncbi:MAG: hypothetical protein WEF53_14945 [Bacteroidota bacterium]
MKIISVLTILVVATFSSFAQTDLSGRFQIGGSVGYSYSSSKTFGSLNKSHSISFQPKVGLFLIPSLEVTVGPSILVALTKLEPGLIFIDGFPFATGPYESESYGLGFTPGITYHFITDGTVVPFAAVSASILWQRVLAGAPKALYTTGWSKPTIIVPNIDGGVRIFLSNDWALQIALTYTRMHQNLGDTDRGGSALALGTGFAIFL